MTASLKKLLFKVHWFIMSDRKGMVIYGYVL